MGINKKILFATLLASSCLFSTNVVKADQVSSDAESTNVSQTTDATSQAVAESPTVSDNTEQSQSVTQTQDAQTQPSTQQPVQQATDQSVDGVYTVGSHFIRLYNADGTPISDRGLGPNSDWYTDQRHSLSDGSSYYHVSTYEYANASEGRFQSYVQPYQGNATVVYRDNSSVHSFAGYGNKAVYNGNNLPTGSNWKVSNYAKVNGKEWYQISANTWVPQDYVVINNGQYKTADWISGVPLIAQRPELPNGCEITAVTMMLQYAGAKVDKMEMAREMPRSSNPNYGYIGQPWDQTGITIFPPALMSLVEKYAGTAKNLTGQNFDAIKYQINLGHPVVTWNTLYGFPYHALVITGYDQNYVYYNDCWTDQTLQMGINQFINNWNTQNRRAISY